MVFFNWATMQMAAKIVYYGPGLCGKTTNLSYIYAKTAPGSRGEMVSLETETDRTLFFDLLPLEVGKVGGFRTRLQLYTVPGQVFYNTTRKLVLKGVDGMVFVADSQRPMAEANIESLQNLEENLLELGLPLDTVPLVLQYNKRDLKNTLTVEDLNAKLNPDGRWEFFESVAVDGTGIFETLKAITKLTLRALRRRMVSPETAATSAPVPARPAAVEVQGAHPHVAFSPAALAAAAAEGLGTPASAPALPAPEAPPAPPQAAPEPEPPQPAAAAAEPAPVAVAAVPEPAASPEDDTAEFPAAEEADEAPVEFATSPEPEEEKVLETEIRHVKVTSSLDILAELETLRKSSTFQPEPRKQASEGAPSLDLDALLQGSVNSRQEVKRRIDEKVGGALALARQCRVDIHLLDERGHSLKKVAPVEVKFKRDERLRQLMLTLIVNLQGE